LLHVLVVEGRGSIGCFLGFVVVTAVWLLHGRFCGW
jgi:hypothetical protein